MFASLSDKNRSHIAVSLYPSVLGRHSSNRKKPVDYLRFHCPVCNHLLVVPPEAAGAVGPCPECQTLIKSPSAPAPAPAQQPQPFTPPAPIHEERSTPALVDAPPTPEPIVEQPTYPDQPTYPEPPISQEVHHESPPVIVAPPEDEPEPAVPLVTPPSPTLQEPSPVEEAPPTNEVPDRIERKKARSRRGGLSLLQALALSVFFSIGFFVLGFYLGKTGAISWEDIAARLQKAELQQPSNSQDEATPPSDETDFEITPLPNDLTSAEGIPLSGADLEAQASLEAFLGAGSWSARNAYVLFPDQMIPEMEACALVHDDGTIAYEEITLTQSQSNLKVFWIKTPNNEHTFSIALIQENGRWLIDWSSFVDFYHNRLHSFAKGKKGPHRGIFRVFLKAAPGETSPLSPSHCLVTAPQNSESFQVNSAPESQARKSLAEIFQAHLQNDRERFEDVMSSHGTPLIVEISRTATPNPTLNLTRIVTVGWPPLSPNELKKDNLSSFY